MADFALFDWLALAFFAAAWAAYYLYNERFYGQRTGLNQIMHEHRLAWMRRSAERENRIVDANIMAGLQNGTAFFASTSLLAIGGTLSALGATDTALEVFSALPFGVQTTRAAFEIKVIGLTLILAYAFFKFAWSYRLFNYTAILMGSMPNLGTGTPEEIETATRRAAAMNTSAGRHFNRGLRGFFYALAYLGWFAGPLAFAATTLAVALVLWRRQFSSDSFAAAGLP